MDPSNQPPDDVPQYDGQAAEGEPPAQEEFVEQEGQQEQWQESGQEQEQFQEQGQDQWQQEQGQDQWQQEQGQDQWQQEQGQDQWQQEQGQDQWQEQEKFEEEFEEEEDTEQGQEDYEEETMTETNLEPLQSLDIAGMGDSALNGERQFPRPIQQTLAIIKPGALELADEIINVIRREGLAILQTRRVQLTPEQAASFYQDMYETEWFAGAVTNLSSGPCLAMILCGPNAIRHWLELMGPPCWKDRAQVPTCLRAVYGKDGCDFENALHGSANETDALRELHFFFPEVIVEPIFGDNLASLYLNQNVHPVLTVGLSKLVRERPEDPVMWLADWLLANNPNKAKESGTGNDMCI